MRKQYQCGAQLGALPAVHPHARPTQEHNLIIATCDDLLGLLGIHDDLNRLHRVLFHIYRIDTTLARLLLELDTTSSIRFTGNG